MIDLTKLFDGPDQWTQYSPARTSTGEAVQAFSPDAVCFCLVGRLNVLLAPDEARNAVRSAISLLFPGRNDSFWATSTFNDHHDTAFSDVQAVLKRAQEILETA